MIALISFLATLIFSTLVVRIATVALTMTGIARDVARFQALSAFTGVGFTTTEAESIINHPIRRRIIAITIRLGSLGLVTTATTLLITFVGADSAGEEVNRLVILIVSLIIMGILASSQQLDRILSNIIQWGLNRWAGFDLITHDYDALFNFSEGYSIGELQIQDNDWIADKTLAETRLQQEGVIVLGIRRDDGTYIGAPHGETRICSGDQLIVYGRKESLMDLDTRKANPVGDMRHQQAVADYTSRVEKQDTIDTYSSDASSERNH